MVNKQGQTRLAQYYEYLTIDERRALEGEIVRKCLARNEHQVQFFTYPITITYPFQQSSILLSQILNYVSGSGGLSHHISI